MLQSLQDVPVNSAQVQIMQPFGPQLAGERLVLHKEHGAIGFVKLHLNKPRLLKKC